ncbi:hypothetical protein SCLCIDRAFT_82417, partial [Scleroderma citrinum Foug A]
IVEEGFDQIAASLTDLAARSGQPPQQLMDRFIKQYACLNSANDWNKYGKFYTQNMEAELEHLRKSGEDTIMIDMVTVRKRCYELFKKDNPNWQRILLKFEESIQYDEVGKTFAQWQQLFNKSAKRLMQSFTALSKTHGIEGAFVMAGSIVNQDASLGYTYTTFGAEDFFMQCCRADSDAIIGHLKAHI